MLASQEIAEAQAAREERERIENESANDVRYQMAIAGFTTAQNTHTLQMAKHLGRKSAVHSSGRAATVFYDKAAGTFSVTVYAAV